MLTVYPMPDLLDDKGVERISNGAQINGDGHGWAVIVGDRILTGKSMDATTAIEGFARAYARATGPALFHSRWATHGETNVSNVHPFPVRKIKDTYVAHNGILPAEAFPEKGDRRSDTRIFADEILPQRFRHLDSDRTRDRLGDWLGGNKIAVLTTNRKYRRNLYVFGLERGTWADGVWYSNDDFEGYAHRWLGRFGATNHEWLGEVCNYCDQRTIDQWGYCESCATCQDCWETRMECQCYTGSSPAVLGTVKPDDDDLWESARDGDEPALDSAADQQAYADWLRENANDNDVLPADSPGDLVPLWMVDGMKG
jgi:glutamine amidotransferase